jgi:hypothetical protein
MLTVPLLAVQVHSGCEPSGMLAVALPAVLVATGAIAGGVPELIEALVLVPQI